MIDKESQSTDLREFMIVLRRALLVIVRWIEKRYGLKRHEPNQPPE
jgi:hypothetical protein